MGCFLVQKSRKRMGEEDAMNEQQELPGQAPPPVPPSFRSRVRAIQHAQRFINRSNPRFRAALGCGGSYHTSAAMDMASPPPVQVENRTRPMPMPLPSPHPSSTPSCYRLPLPEEHAAPLITNVSPPCLSPPFTSPKLPLSPSPSKTHGASALKGIRNVAAPINASDPKPLPPPPDGVAALRWFTCAEIAAACNNFSPNCRVGDSGASPAYRGTIQIEKKGQKKTEHVTVTRFCTERSQLGHKEWLAELSNVSRLQGPHLCKILGFHAEEGSKERLIVYERLPKGSLDRLLFGRADSPPLDWPSRLKIALGAAQGLAYLHWRLPEPIAYKVFRTSHVDVDFDFSSKLYGYGFANSSVDVDCLSNPVADAYLAPETLNGGHASPKSNVWSFGVMLLELLTGRQHGDPIAPKEERNLVKWTRPFLTEEGRLFLVMDPKLQGRFPSKGAKMIADLALQCLVKDPSRRPTIREALDVVKPVQEMRYTSRFPLREPTNNNQTGAQIPAPSPQTANLGHSPSRIVSRALVTAAPKKIPSKLDLIESPPLRPLIIPSRTSCNRVFEEGMTKRREFSSGTIERPQNFQNLSSEALSRPMYVSCSL